MTSELEREIEQSPKVTATFTFGAATKPCDDMPHNWRVTLRHRGRRLSVNFYGWSAIFNPSTADVLSSLLLDASLGEETFEDFCDDLGYDPDSRKAFADWEACRDSGPKLRRLLGASWDRFEGLEH